MSPVGHFGVVLVAAAWDRHSSRAERDRNQTWLGLALTAVAIPVATSWATASQATDGQIDPSLEANVGRATRSRSDRPRLPDGRIDGRVKSDSEWANTPPGNYESYVSAVMAYNSPLDYVRRMRPTLERYPLRSFIYGGESDPDSGQIPEMAQVAGPR